MPKGYSIPGGSAGSYPVYVLIKEMLEILGEAKLYLAIFKVDSWIDHGVGYISNEMHDKP